MLVKMTLVAGIMMMMMWKHGSQITVQSTAMARRTHRAVGRSVALNGRREKVQDERKNKWFLMQMMMMMMKRFILPSLQACHDLRREIKLTGSCARKHDKTSKTLAFIVICTLTIYRVIPPKSLQDVP